MNNYDKLVRDYIKDLCPGCDKYCPLGRTYLVDNEFYYGNYWYYETDDFIIDIHDFHIKKDFVEENIPDMSPYLFLISKYLISGSGEWLEPYQVLEANSMFIMDTKKPLKKYLLHGGSRYFMIGMMFKEDMINKYIVEKKHIKIKEVPRIFMETKETIIKPIGRLADEILSCKMDGVSAELFLEAKAKEWLSITIDAYENRKNIAPMNRSDKKAIELVANYINDHYALDIPQSFLEKIAAMSGTKLKKSFKEVYNMTITEYTQRKRMNMAENLLMATDMEVRDIAKSVGYNSPSHFSSLFKRYKGLSPNELRKL